MYDPTQHLPGQFSGVFVAYWRRRQALTSLATWSCLIACLAGVGCGEHSKYSLSESAGDLAGRGVATASNGASATDGADISDPELEGLRKRMAVRVVTESQGECSNISCGQGEVCVNPNPIGAGECDFDDDGTADPDSMCCVPAEQEMDDYDLAFDLIAGCFPPQFTGDNCEFTMAALVDPAICAANRLLDAAGLRDTPLTYTVRLPAGGGAPNIASAPVGATRSIPPQSAASRVSLGLAAYRLVVYGLRLLMTTDFVGTPPVIATRLSSCSPETAGRLGTAVPSLYYLAQEALDLATENTLAVADSRFGESSSMRQRTADAFLSTVLSRSAAAHLLVGGDPGLPTTTAATSAAAQWGNAVQFSICNQSPLTPQARVALDTMREAAVSPADVLDDSLDIQLLVNDVSSSAPDYAHGSVLERLREIWQSADLNTSGQLEDALGLRLEDFQEAREYLAQEIRVFARSQQAFLPKRTLAGGGLTAYMRYAATATPPPNRDPMYWVTVAQYQDLGADVPYQTCSNSVTTLCTADASCSGGTCEHAGQCSNNQNACHDDGDCGAGNTCVLRSLCSDASTACAADGDCPSGEFCQLGANAPATARASRFGNSPHYSDLSLYGGSIPEDLDAITPLASAQFGLAGFIDATVEHATHLVNTVEAQTNAGPAKDAFQSAMLLFLQDARKQRPGRIEYVEDGTNTTVIAHCFEAADGLLLVEGEDGLSCAVNGNVEGMACSLANAIAVSQHYDAPAGGCSVAASTVTNASSRLKLKTHYYLVAPREAGLSEPGQYESLASIPTPSSRLGSSSTELRRYIPIVPELAARAARILTPSRKWCARPLVSCAGQSFDTRIPLEDELSDDGDGVESSWRYYLDLARQAADEADMLGEQVVGLDLDEILRDEQKQIRQIQRSESAVEELQDICGLDVDPTELLRALSDDGTKNFSAVGAVARNEVCSAPCTDASDCAADGGWCTAGGVCAGGNRPCSTLADCMSPDAVCEGGTCRMGTKDCSADPGVCDSASVCLTESSCVLDSHCPKNTTCVNGTCAMDPLLFTQIGLFGQGLQDQDFTALHRLNECLAPTKLEPYGTLGDKPLCIWVKDNAENYICQDATPDNACPQFLDPEMSGGCMAQLSPPAGHSVRTVSRTLDYFEVESGVAGHTVAGVCDKIRELRKTPGSSQKIADIRDSNFFDPQSLEAVGRRIVWLARAGGYSFLRYGDRYLAYTGANLTSSASELSPTVDVWPCGQGSSPPTGYSSECGTTQSGLFCMYGDCSNESVRANLNRRLRDAAIAARDLTVKDVATNLNGFIMPAYLLNDGSWASVTGFWSKPQLTTKGETIINGIPHLYWNLPVAREQRESDAFGAAMRCDGPSGICASASVWTLPGGAGFPSTPSGPFTFGLVSAMPLLRTPPWRILDSDVDFTAVVAHQAALFEYEPSYWFANLNQSMRGAPTVRDRARAHWGYLHDQLSGRPRTQIGSLLDVPERVVFDPGGDREGFAGLVQDGVHYEPLDQELQEYRRTPQTMLDGMELLCEAVAGPAYDCGEPPDIRNPYELNLAASYLECVAQDIRRRTAYGVLTDVPVRALDALREEGPIGAFPAVGGEMGKAISALREHLMSLARHSNTLSDSMRQLGYDLRTLERNLAVAGLEEELRSVNFAATVSSQIAACASATSSVFNVMEWGAAGAAAATCANSIAQIRFAGQIKALQGEIAEIATEQQIDRFQSDFEDRAGDIDDTAGAITAAQEGIDSQLLELENLRRRGRRSLSKALLMDSDMMAAEQAFDQLSFVRRNTARLRYERAHQSAKLMAFLARRGIEQRLGVDLSTVSDNLPLVDAPKTWADRVCETTGLDFGDVGAGNSYADAYIGDYVGKLEKVVESYRQVNNFHEGTDTAVISLRDDVKNSRALCSVPVNNLLYQAGQLDRPTVFDESGGVVTPGWDAVGCGADPTTGDVLGSCVSATRLNPEIAPCATDGNGVPLPPCEPDMRVQPGQAVEVDVSDPITTGAPALSDGYGYNVRFGVDPDGMGTCDASAGGACGFRSTSALAQEVELWPGRYRLSWYARRDTGPSGYAPSAWVGIQRAGESTLSPFPAQDVAEDAGALWSRYDVTFAVTDYEAVKIGVMPGPIADPLMPATQELYLAALMLEDITQGGHDYPATFANTSFLREQDLPLCEDTTGEVFRQRFWRRGCMQLCADGFGSSCANVNATLHCYRELVFSIDPRSIEAGNSLRSSGFARGNFNYRVESVGFNVVGTGTRNCEDVETPSTCFGGSFVPFSLEHIGPYRVRNFEGDDVRVELFPGVIEHARALAAERYLTNPLSASDRALVEPYSRRELRGRPLDGYYVLRIWEEEGVDFSKIEDVQLVLDYRYWTRNL